MVVNRGRWRGNGATNISKLRARSKNQHASVADRSIQVKQRDSRTVKAYHLECFGRPLLLIGWPAFIQFFVPPMSLRLRYDGLAIHDNAGSVEGQGNGINHCSRILMKKDAFLLQSCLTKTPLLR